MSAMQSAKDVISLYTSFYYYCEKRQAQMLLDQQTLCGNNARAILQNFVVDKLLNKYFNIK